MSHYLRLVASYTPDAMLGFLTTHSDDVNIDDCLVIVQEKSIFDATSFLYERLGDPFKACDLLLKEVNRRLAKCKKDLDSAICGIPEAGAGGAEGAAAAAKAALYKSISLKKILTLHNSDPAKHTSIRELSQYPYLHYTCITLLTQLCIRHRYVTAPDDGSDNGDDSAPRTLWFKVFDYFTQERRKQPN
jgi:hypothetical protein